MTRASSGAVRDVAVTLPASETSQQNVGGRRNWIDVREPVSALRAFVEKLHGGAACRHDTSRVFLDRLFTPRLGRSELGPRAQDGHDLVCIPT